MTEADRLESKLIDRLIDERDAARVRIVELEEQIEHGYVRRMCANTTCKMGSFMPNRIDQQFCSKQCRDAHNQRAMTKRKRLTPAEVERIKNEKPS